MEQKEKKDEEKRPDLVNCISCGFPALRGGEHVQCDNCGHANGSCY